MERPYISQELRRLVADRADRLCEYCLMHKQDTVFGCAIDHVISLKHGGSFSDAIASFQLWDHSPKQ